MSTLKFLLNLIKKKKEKLKHFYLLMLKIPKGTKQSCLKIKL